MPIATAVPLAATVHMNDASDTEEPARRRCAIYFTVNDVCIPFA